MWGESDGETGLEGQTCSLYMLGRLQDSSITSHPKNALHRPSFPRPRSAVRDMRRRDAAHITSPSETALPSFKLSHDHQNNNPIGGDLR